MRGKLTNLVEAIKYSIAFLIAQIYKINNKKKIYLIGERKNQCQDNGYHLFNYVRKNYNDQEFYYCITKDSNQLKSIESLGKIIYYKTLKHYIYYFLAEKLVCAHVASCTPDSAIVWKMEAKGKIKKKRVFIQHGITKESIPSLMYKNTKFEAFICGAKPEFDYVKSTYGYPKNHVKYTGLARFDALKDFKVKDYILVMPTWRQCFGMDNCNEASNEDFQKSKYFKAYQNILNDQRINEILQKNQIELIFYPHNEMQRYVHLFKSSSEKIKIAKVDDYDVQTLLKEAKILITDYSSIAFDFAYMKKPMLYYQFDEKEYFENHYNKGYFSYQENGFGKVCNDTQSFIKELEVIINNDCKIEGKYSQRCENFFELCDKNNCERNYKVVVDEL